MGALRHLDSIGPPSPAYTHPSHLEDNMEGSKPDSVHNLPTDDDILDKWKYQPHRTQT